MTTALLERPTLAPSVLDVPATRRRAAGLTPACFVDQWTCGHLDADAPRLLDMFCGVGGAGVGYHLAGWYVEGVDLRPQPHYPFPFTRGDALAAAAERGHRYDAWHGSPPCQGYAWGTPKRRRAAYAVGLIGQLRDLADDAALPLVMENVTGAEPEYRHPVLVANAWGYDLGPLFDGVEQCALPVARPIVLCGEMFRQSHGLRVIRHRVFEVGEAVPQPAHLAHGGSVRGGAYVTVAGHGADNAPGNYSVEAWRCAMGMPWAHTHRELAEAIPPAYTEYIGAHLLAWL